MELLKASYELLLKADEILKVNFDHESIMNNSSIDEENELILVKDSLDNYIQYDICDCYTLLIKVLKIYRCEQISDIYKFLKKISLEAESIC